MFNQAPAPGWFLRPDLWSLYMPQIGARVWPDEQSGAQNPFQANLLEPGAEPQFANLSYNGPPPPANSAAASFSNFMAPPAASVWDTGAPAFMPDPFNFSMPGPDLSGSLPLASVYLNGANSASSADDRPSATPSVWDSGAPAILSDPFSGMPAQNDNSYASGAVTDETPANAAPPIDPYTLDTWQWGAPPSPRDLFGFGLSGALLGNPPWNNGNAPFNGILPEITVPADDVWTTGTTPVTPDPFNFVIPNAQPIGAPGQDDGNDVPSTGEQADKIATAPQDSMIDESSLAGDATHEGSSGPPESDRHTQQGDGLLDSSAARRRPPKHAAPHKSPEHEKHANPKKKEKKEPQKSEPPRREERQEQRRSIPDDVPLGAKLTGKELGEYENTRQLRSRALDFAQKYLRNRTVVNKETGFSILINMKGLKHTTAQNRPDAEFQAIPALQELLANAKYVRHEPDKHVPARREIKTVHIFRSAVEIAGQRVPVRMIVRETKEGKFFYDLHRDKLLD